MSTFEAQEFSVRPLYDITKNVRMSNLKNGKQNVHIAQVRKVLTQLFPSNCPPTPEDIWDYNFTQGVLLFQRSLGEEETGILTKDQVIALSHGQDWQVVA